MSKAINQRDTIRSLLFDASKICLVLLVALLASSCAPSQNTADVGTLEGSEDSDSRLPVFFDVNDPLNLKGTGIGQLSPVPAQPGPASDVASLPSPLLSASEKAALTSASDEEEILERSYSPEELSDSRIVSAAASFDENEYRRLYDDVNSTIENGQLASGSQHYYQFGILESRSPNLLFNEHAYLARYPDVDQAVSEGSIQSGFQHYQLRGINEGRVIDPLFDEARYLRENPDVIRYIQFCL